MYNKIVIDFMTDEQCVFCDSGRTLKKGIVLRNLETKELVVSSTSCFDKHIIKISNPKEVIPNLTKGVIGKPSESYKNSDNTQGGKTSHQISNLEYLILRQEKLSHIKGIKYDGIQDIYDSYKKDFKISETEDFRLNKFIESTIEKFPDYSPRNLQKLYASLFWLKYAIDKQRNEKSKKFLQDIHDKYQKSRKLSRKQVDSVYETLKNLNSKIEKKTDMIPEIELNVA
jgi:hypothetical protein